MLDDETVPFGIRDAHFDAATGFWLNGKNFKIKGVCLHADGGAFGAAVPLRVWERRLETLKALGVNAIRTAHNPPAPEFLDLCDRMGFLVMDEMFDCWTVAKNPVRLSFVFQRMVARRTRATRSCATAIIRASFSTASATKSTTRRRRNWPRAFCSGLVDVFHAADPTRPVTQALFRPNVSHDYDDGLADLLDVVGQNYRENEILAAHAAQADAQNHRHGEHARPRGVAGAARQSALRRTVSVGGH